MKKKERTVITVDGHAGSGKTTLARRLAERLGYSHFSSGLLYRGLGILALRHGVNLQDEQNLLVLLKTHDIAIVADREGNGILTIDGTVQNEQAVQATDVSEASSIVSASAGVRKALVSFQREAFPGTNIVAEGRDMGTVIFPDAPVKFFIEVDADTRVRRRLAQIGVSENLEGAEETIRREIIERDKRDSERTCAPTKAAEDAVIIDNSSSSMEEVLERMIAVIHPTLF